MGHRLVGGGKLPEPQRETDTMERSGCRDLNSPEEEAVEGIGQSLTPREGGRMLQIIFLWSEWRELVRASPGVSGQKPASSVVRWGVSKAVGPYNQPFNLNPRERMRDMVPDTHQRVSVWVRFEQRALDILAEMENGSCGCVCSSQQVRWAVLRYVLGMSPTAIRKVINLKGRPKVCRRGRKPKSKPCPEE